jgi:AcrR family transcriptional regulator
MQDSERKLPGKQEPALAALLQHGTTRAAAKACGVNESTLWRYLQDAEFQRRHREARRAVVEQTISMLQQAGAAAVATLVKVMQDTDAPASARVAAARAIIEQGIGAVELTDLMERIDALEATQKGKL